MPVKVLLDTNVITRLLNRAAHEQRALAYGCLIKLREELHIPCIVPQTLIEFWAVATLSAEDNGLDFTAEQARREIEGLLTVVRFLHDEVAVHTIWLSLVTSYQLTGRTVFDARLVANMIRHGISHLITFNPDNFAAYREITAAHPAGVAAGGLA
jgi:predicted nucleic acid-binding protein